MKNKRNALLCMVILLAGFIYFPVQAQQKQTKSGDSSAGPNRIARNIIQDKKGNIWIAAFDGVFRYDGKSFTNITSTVSSVTFFSVLEDRKGNLWFGSMGSGVFLYDGRTFKNFTTRDGLAGNGVTCIYEDKTGNVWFGTDGGASCYNGKFFRNYTIKDGLTNNSILAIIEDKVGKFWFGTSGDVCIYDGKRISVFTYKGKHFNVRSIIEDKKSNIWLGCVDGLWRYNGSTFTNITRNFVGYVYEDKKGNIWTSSESINNQDWASSSYDKKGLSGLTGKNDLWVLSRYDKKSLFNKRPAVTEIKPGKGMICGVLEANDGSIWFGASDGVYRYDGNTINSFNHKEGQK